MLCWWCATNWFCRCSLWRILCNGTFLNGTSGAVNFCSFVLHIGHATQVVVPGRHCNLGAQSIHNLWLQLVLTLFSISVIEFQHTGQSKSSSCSTISIVPKIWGSTWFIAACANASILRFFNLNYYYFIPVQFLFKIKFFFATQEKIDIYLFKNLPIQKTYL